MQKVNFQWQSFQHENNNISCHLQPLLLRTIYIAYLTAKFVPNDFGLKEVQQFVIIYFWFGNYGEMVELAFSHNLSSL